ncbi:MAG TPA: hypothetical protein VN958_00595 [Chitinophagaceae bacterium]|nr:hypothetical protein [Chitinophagaceae bacterium]
MKRLTFFFTRLTIILFACNILYAQDLPSDKNATKKPLTFIAT